MSKAIQCPWHGKQEPTGNCPQLNTATQSYDQARRLTIDATAKLKRSLREWPVCPYGGDVTLDWSSFGDCFWRCTCDHEETIVAALPERHSSDHPWSDGQSFAFTWQ